MRLYNVLLNRLRHVTQSESCLGNIFHCCYSVYLSAFLIPFDFRFITHQSGLHRNWRRWCGCFCRGAQGKPDAQAAKVSAPCVSQLCGFLFDVVSSGLSVFSTCYLTATAYVFCFLLIAVFYLYFKTGFKCCNLGVHAYFDCCFLQ